MIYKRKKVFVLIPLLFSISFLAVASETHEHHEPNILSLVPQYFNFFILFGGLFIVLKNKLKVIFEEKYKTTVQRIERAEILDREATAKLDSYGLKIKNLQADINQIEKRSAEDLKQFVLNLEKNSSKKIEKIKLDTIYRIESEKNVFLRNLNQQIVDSVIDHAREMIEKNSDYQKKISKNLLGVMAR